MTKPTERETNEGTEQGSKDPVHGDDGGNGPNDRSRRITTRELLNPRLEVGGETFLEEWVRSAQLHLHEDEFSEFRSASVTLNPPFDGRWDYLAETRLYEDGNLIITGICSGASHGSEGRLHLKIWGPVWYLERTTLRNLGTFGMSNKENFYWAAKLTNPVTGAVGPVVEGLELDTTLRPFMFAVPLQNLKSSAKGILLTADTGIASHEYENVFRTILTQFKEIEGVLAWSDENPKIFGTVFAENLLQADQTARDRAELMIGIINLALTTGMSHFDTRYRGELIDFNAETSLTPVSLHPWIIIRETSQVKGWIRERPTAKLESETNLGDSLDRIRFFLSKFDRASESGDVHDQLGRRELSARERRLSLGTKRALRWLNFASSEDDIRDRFTATWIAFESILSSIIYPGVFEGERATIREEIRREVRKIILPNATRESLAITTEMIEGRLTQNQ